MSLFYHAIKFENGEHLSLNNLYRFLRALEDLRDFKGMNPDAPLEIWAKEQEGWVGFLVGDTGSLPEEGWERRL